MPTATMRQGRLVSTDNAGTAGVAGCAAELWLRCGEQPHLSDGRYHRHSGRRRSFYPRCPRPGDADYPAGHGVAEKRVDMTYDAASQMTGLARYSDIAGIQSVADTAYVHDAAGRLTDLTHGRNSGVIADYGFTYDVANRLTQLTTPDGTSDYSYNGRAELTSSDHSYQDDEGYTYDDTGNRTNAGYVTGDHNRLLSDGTYTYEYDNEGNRVRRVAITSGENTEYSWDYRNRLTSVVTKDSSGAITKSVEYTYDVYDRRIAKSVDSDGDGAATATEERYVYDGEHIALVFDGEGNQVSRYLHGPQIDQVLAEETADGEVRWALSDHQGSVRDVIDSEGTVLNHITYDSYGQVISETNPEVDFRFGYTGRERDEETGLYYYRARYFDPAVGTFVSADPLGFAAGDANVYRYVFNSPTNYIDPNGKSAASLGGSLVGGGALAAAIDGPLPFGDIIAAPLVVTGGTLLIYDRIRSERSIDIGYDPGLDSNRANQLPQSTIENLWDLPSFPREAYSDEGIGGFCEAPGELINPSIPGFGEGLQDLRDLSSPYFEAGGIQFGSNENQSYHTFRHTDDLGLNRQDVEDAVLADIMNNVGEISPGLNKGTTVVDGVEIDYHAFRLADGTINIGRITGR